MCLFVYFSLALCVTALFFPILFHFSATLRFLSDFFVCVSWSTYYFVADFLIACDWGWDKFVHVAPSFYSKPSPTPHPSTASDEDPLSDTELVYLPVVPIDDMEHAQEVAEHGTQLF